MELGKLIERLAAFPDQAYVVADGFGRPHSWRGVYAEVAFDPAQNVTVASMLEHARSALGATFCGWKGGEYVMDAWTATHIAEHGEYGGDADHLTSERLSHMLGECPLAARERARCVAMVREKAKAYRRDGEELRRDLEMRPSDAAEMELMLEIARVLDALADAMAAEPA